MNGQEEVLWRSYAHFPSSHFSVGHGSKGQPGAAHNICNWPLSSLNVVIPIGQVHGLKLAYYVRAI